MAKAAAADHIRRRAGAGAACRARLRELEKVHGWFTEGLPTIGDQSDWSVQRSAAQGREHQGVDVITVEDEQQL